MPSHAQASCEAVPGRLRGIRQSVGVDPHRKDAGVDHLSPSHAETNGKEPQMPELMIDFITSLDGYGPPTGGLAGGAWKGPSTSPGWETSRRRTTHS